VSLETCHIFIYLFPASFCPTKRIWVTKEEYTFSLVFFKMSVVCYWYAHSHLRSGRFKNKTFAILEAF
jgi:hypothetical protein